MQGLRRLGFLGLQIGCIGIVLAHQAGLKRVEHFWLLADGGRDLAARYFGPALFS